MVVVPVREDNDVFALPSISSVPVRDEIVADSPTMLTVPVVEDNDESPLLDKASVPVRDDNVVFPVPVISIVDALEIIEIDELFLIEEV
jgi:hypothetical protein